MINRHTKILSLIGYEKVKEYIFNPFIRRDKTNPSLLTYTLI